MHSYDSTGKIAYWTPALPKSFVVLQYLSSIDQLDIIDGSWPVLFLFGPLCKNASFKVATVVADKYLLGPISVPSCSLNLTSKYSSPDISQNAQILVQKTLLKQLRTLSLGTLVRP